MLPYCLKKIWTPGIFQGGNRNRKYFEGWYYKIVDEREKHIYAIIPGISISEDMVSSHAFIQIIDGVSMDSSYFKYDIKDFWFSKKTFEINIGQNHFTDKSMILNIDSEKGRIKGNLCFENQVGWPVGLISPGAMGWYRFVPFMECYHGIISMDHSIKGYINVNGLPLDFNDGRGYIEKDWGRSFPSSWIWLQSNHFENADISVTASVARIPWIGKDFVGFIAGLWINERLYRFTSYTGAKLKVCELNNKRILISLEDRNFRLDIAATRSDTVKLASPQNGLMNGKVDESISAVVECSFYKISEGKSKLFFSGRGRNTGLEVMGDMDEIITLENNI